MSSFNTPPAERLGGAPAAKSAAKRDVAVSAGAVQTPATVGAESARRRASGGSACVASVWQWAPKRRAVAPGAQGGSCRVLTVDKTAVKVDEDTHDPCARTRAPARATPSRSPPLKPPTPTRTLTIHP